MFIPDPDFLPSRIPDPGFRISDTGSNKKKSPGENFLSAFSGSHEFHKIKFLKVKQTFLAKDF